MLSHFPTEYVKGSDSDGFGCAEEKRTPQSFETVVAHKQIL